MDKKSLEIFGLKCYGIKSEDIKKNQVILTKYVIYIHLKIRVTI